MGCGVLRLQIKLSKELEKDNAQLLFKAQIKILWCQLEDQLCLQKIRKYWKKVQYKLFSFWKVSWQSKWESDC
jgi:hypothetical protein